MATARDLEAALHAFGLERDRLRSAMAAALGIGVTELGALEHLEAGPLSQRELGDRLLLTSGAVTMLVDRLERRGLVRREAHPTDRRTTLLRLTPSSSLPDVPEITAYHRRLAAAAASITAAARSDAVAFLTAVRVAGSDAADGIRKRPVSEPSSPRRRGRPRAGEKS